jgi:hypothetical protein
MNEDQPMQPVELSAKRLLGEMRDYAGREPVKAVAAAFAAGVMINLLPTRVLVASVTAVGGALLRPALLSLGVIKSLELCCQKPTT